MIVGSRLISRVRAADSQHHHNMYKAKQRALSAREHVSFSTSNYQVNILFNDNTGILYFC